ncbi:MAG: uroporphyrinogen decarboxylase family protein [Saccharofermentanales bacterium]
MTRREMFFKAVRREMEGYVPFEFQLTSTKLREFHERTGRWDYMEYYDIPMRILWGYAADRSDIFSHLYKDLDDMNCIDVWGIGYQNGSMPCFQKIIYPMKGYDSLEQFENYPYPDPLRDWDWELFRKDVDECKAKDLIAVGSAPTWIYEIAWMMWGMEDMLADMATDGTLTEYHMDRLTDIKEVIVRKQIEAGCDILMLGDDVSNQRGMTMSIELWRRFHKPRLAHLIDAARELQPDIPVYFHSDGNPEMIIPELIEIGVDILNPVQPECMDPVNLKEIYGDRLSFWGTIGTQTTMPFGTPEDVRQACREMIEKVGKGGGLVLAPTHLIEPEVPWENIEAFVQTITAYNGGHRF